MKHLAFATCLFLMIFLLSSTGCEGKRAAEAGEKPTKKEVMQEYQTLRDSLAEQFQKSLTQMKEKQDQTELSELSISKIRSLSKPTPTDSSQLVNKRP